MSEHIELVKVLKEPENPSDHFQWMNRVSALKVKGEKWKNFPPVSMFHGKNRDKKDFWLWDKAKNFKVYPDDIFLCGYMRSGNTMMQEMIWLIVNDFDFVKAKSIIRGKRFPYFDVYDVTQKMRDGENYERMEDMARPRCFKSHFPTQLLPDDIWQQKPKIIHMSRNVKDVAVSTYYFLKDVANIKGTLDEFFEDFLNDKVLFTPYREHYLNYINLPDYPNIMYLTYEWVTQNMDETIHKVTKFLGKEISDENFKLLKEHMSFESMKSKWNV
ncbi:hypothetical protein ACKWTF_005811 [Chironomus riparius]